MSKAAMDCWLQFFVWALGLHFLSLPFHFSQSLLPLCGVQCGRPGEHNLGQWRGQGEALGILAVAIPEPGRSVPGLALEFPLG